jgi:glycosyltransferase involved in cell wall biosynthesis
MLTAVKRQNDSEHGTAAASPGESLAAEALLPVVFAITQSGKQANGGVESISQVLEHLRQVKPIVVTQTETPANVRWRNAGCKVQVWETAKESWKTLAALRTNFRMFRLVRSSGCRVVHCNDISAVWNTSFGARLAGAAVVFNVRNIKPDEKSYGWRWWVARRVSNRQLVLSREMQSSLARRLNVQNGNGSVGKIDFIYSAVDPGRFNPIDEPGRAQLRQRLGIDRNCFAIGYVAPFDPRKAQLEFIKKAGPILKRQLARAKVYFIGDFAPDSNDYSRRCLEAADDLGLQESVAFMGYTPDVAEWYRALDVVVVASRNEGLARCMIESLACGTPVVSFDVCSAREILEAHGCGLVVQGGDYQQLIGQIVTLSEQSETRTRLAKSAVALASRLFNPETIAGDYEQLYFSLNGN